MISSCILPPSLWDAWSVVGNAGGVVQSSGAFESVCMLLQRLPTPLHDFL